MRILQEVCSLLIKGSKTGPDAFTWYQMGVESHLRITNLYEYYMASVDLDSVAGASESDSDVFFFPEQSGL